MIRLLALSGLVGFLRFVRFDAFRLRIPNIIINKRLAGLVDLFGLVEYLVGWLISLVSLTGWLVCLAGLSGWLVWLIVWLVCLDWLVGLVGWLFWVGCFGWSV